MALEKFSLLIYMCVLSVNGYAQSIDSVVTYTPDSIKNYWSNRKYINSDEHLFLPGCCSPENVTIVLSPGDPTIILDSGVTYKPLLMQASFRNGELNGPIKLFCRGSMQVAVEGNMKNGKEDGLFIIYEYYSGNMKLRLIGEYISYKHGKLNGPRVLFVNYTDKDEIVKSKISKVFFYKNDRLMSGFSEAEKRNEGRLGYFKKMHKEDLNLWSNNSF